MPYAHMVDNVWQEVTGPFTVDEISYPANAPELWSDEALAAIGIFPITEAVSPALPHQRMIGVELVTQNGLPARVSVFEEITLDERKGNLLAAIRAERWAREQAGFMGPGGPVRTDDATQNKVTGAVQYFSITGVLSADWELTPGNFATVTAADVTAMATAIGQHVQACFTRSRQLTEAALAAASHAQLTAINITEGWPQ